MGRPQGELRGRTAQANALAEWLRTVIGHVPVRELEAALYVGKSSWGAYRSGSTLITEKLLTEVVDRYIPDSAMRERQRAEGLRLLAEAEEAGRTFKDGGPQAALVVRPRHREPLAVALLRLDDARLLQMEAMRKRADSEKQCTLLGSTVKVLQDRCLVLERERDRALEDRAKLQRELDLSLEYRRQAGEQLEHARHARSAAERLALTADEHVMRERFAVERQAAVATPAEEPADGGRDAAGEDLGLAPLDQIEAVLRASREQLEEQDEELDDLRGRMGDEPAESADEPPPIVRGTLLDNETAGRRGVVQPRPVDSDEEPAYDFAIDYTPPAWYTQDVRAPAEPEEEVEAFTIDYTPPDWYTAGRKPPVPTVGPGHGAVLRYRTPDGSVRQIVRHSAPGTPHPEWQILYELRALNVPPHRVLELHTELEPCDLPGGYCARMIEKAWPQALIKREFPYGNDHAGRQAGMRQLLTRYIESQAPVRAVLPPTPLMPSGPRVESATQMVMEAFAPENVLRFSLADALRAGAPPIVRQTLMEAGLPRDMGPFFWSLPGSDQPWPTSTDVAVLGSALVASGANISLVVGHDFGRALCVQQGTLHIMAVPLEAVGPLSMQFVNTGLPEFAHCIALLGRMWPLRHGLTPEQAGRWTSDFQAGLVQLDPPAPASPENWWSLLLEQMWDGLL
ncbi:SUKH-4 family immunity protein [Streptomyces sp. ISL-43]|uniref:SUKH-4 family immunity protein n=1 Tax=Streptomyces sp. ISL-43 TaxID=2819183 RepID=UPI001BEC3AB4|nr:SUKH-4 family immunity protein [Streptomyces sp. ISL-43]MBT2446960.1 SUKH-4 family immunity protein [Streptomyces sp. ISL-43]